MKLLVLILGYNHPICNNYINIVKKTWSKFKNNNINIIYSYGGHEKNEIKEDTIYVTANDFGEENTYNKLLTILDIVYNNFEFDIILKTSNNMYFRLDFLYKVLSKYKLKDFFGSSYDNHLDSGCFSGCTMLLSKDVVKNIIDNKYIDNPKTDYDDTGIEYLLRQIYPNYSELYKNFKRLDLIENSLIRLNDPMFKIKYGDIWAFRCKTTQNRNVDIEKIKLLNQFF
jgi:hypothetical protein